MATFDLIIENGQVVDGTGSPAVRTDVGVLNGKIAAMGDLKQAETKQRLDAEGLVVAPGFIDMHTHSDVVLLADGRGASMLYQGVTTNVTGNCGSSVAPLTSLNRQEFVANMIRGRGHDVDVSWNSFGEYLEALSQAPKAINLAPLVGHGTVRSGVIGHEARLPGADELARMRQSVRQAMAEGAFGMSTGLIFPPGMYSNTHELTEVAKAVAEFDGIHSSHIRGETNPIVDAVEETLTIGRQAGVRTNISHHKSVGRENWGKIRTTHAMIAKAAEEFEVTFDQYPYTTCGGSLSQYPPPWAKAGGIAEMYRRLADPAQRPRIAAGIVDGGADFPNFYKLHWEDIQVAVIPSEKNKWMEGLRIAEIAEKLQKDPVELVMDLMVEEQSQIPVNQHVLKAEDVEFLMQQKEHMVGSDGSALTPDGPTGKGRPHPRNYGAFARVLAYYVREKGIISLEAAIHKMTGKPAAALRLPQRGLLREGYAADITVFDAATIEDRATFAEPVQLAQGVRWVIVNGHLTLADGTISPTLHGAVLAPR